VGCVAHMGETIAVYKVLVGKHEGNRPLRRLSHRWEDNIRMDVTEIGGKLWIGFIWLRIGIGHYIDLATLPPNHISKLYIHNS